MRITRYMECQGMPVLEKHREVFQYSHSNSGLSSERIENALNMEASFSILQEKWFCRLFGKVINGKLSIQAAPNNGAAETWWWGWQRRVTSSRAGELQAEESSLMTEKDLCQDLVGSRRDTPSYPLWDTQSELPFLAKVKRKGTSYITEHSNALKDGFPGLLVSPFTLWHLKFFLVETLGAGVCNSESITC